MSKSEKPVSTSLRWVECERDDPCAVCFLPAAYPGVTEPNYFKLEVFNPARGGWEQVPIDYGA